ncbi:MAG: PhnD/SsuA/transferrin family substrate-binding protein [Candidatus Firestonebacteria bacterium]|nr:PhnD/SsuA/transferrin family substrate-binding protein [Candidatus Firestonebacteria bacterium]
MFLRWGSACLGLAAALALWGTPAPAYFQEPAPGVRPKSMGEAFTAVADDVNALAYNPAGCAQLSAWEISGMYAALFAGMDPALYTGEMDRTGFNLVQVAAPLPEVHGGLGLAWSRLFSAFYQENVAALAYGQAWGPFAFGVAAKVLQWEVASTEYTNDPELFPALARRTWTMDAGLLAYPWKNLRLGAGLQNLLPADAGLLEREEIPAVYRLGAAYLFPAPLPGLQSLQASLEGVWRLNRWDCKLGVETLLRDRWLAVRAGVNREEASCGFGIRIRRPEMPLAMTLDYAFSYPFELRATAGSHWAGLSVFWEPPAPRGPARPASPTASALDTPAAKAATTTAEADSALVQSAAFQEFLAFREFVARHSAVTATAENQTFPATNPAAPARPPAIAGTVPADRQKQILVGFEQILLSDAANPREARERVAAFQKYIEQKTGIALVGRAFDNYEELDRAFRQGELDAVVSSQGLFKLLYRENLAEPLLTAQVRGRDFQSACLLVRDSGEIQELGQLQGKRLGYIAMEDLEGLNRHFFNDNPKFKPEIFFKELKKIQQARVGVLALMVQDVDVLVGYDYMLKVAADVSREQNLPNPIRCLAQVSSIPNTPIFARKTLPPEKRAAVSRLETALLQADRDEAGKAFLTFFHFDCFSKFKEKKYRAYFQKE